MGKFFKVYVAVTLFVDERGKILPVSLFYDGREYLIDKVTDIRLTPPEHVGGLITKRYDCVIKRQVRHLYSEATGRWFLEIETKND